MEYQQKKDPIKLITGLKYDKKKSGVTRKQTGANQFL